MMPQKKETRHLRARSREDVTRRRQRDGDAHAAQRFVDGIRARFAGRSTTILDTGPLVRGAVSAVRLALPHVVFDRDRCLAAVSDGSTQATDVAEALVRKGIPFREAYKATGQLVHYARERNVTLASVDVKAARAIHSAFDESVLAVIDPRAAVLAKKSLGGTAPGASMSSLRGSALPLRSLATKRRAFRRSRASSRD